MLPRARLGPPGASGRPAVARLSSELSRSFVASIMRFPTLPIRIARQCFATFGAVLLELLAGAASAHTPVVLAPTPVAAALAARPARLADFLLLARQNSPRVCEIGRFSGLDLRRHVGSAAASEHFFSSTTSHPLPVRSCARF